MPIENYGRTMQGAADFALMPYNTLMARREQDQIEARRNSLIANENARLQMDQQQFQADQQADARAQTERASIFDLVNQAEDAFEQGGYEAVRPLLGQIAAYDPAVAQGLVRTYQEDAKPAKAPQMRSIYQGSDTVQQEYNPQTGAWDEVGRGSRWQAPSGGARAPAPSQGPSGPALPGSASMADVTRLRKEFRGLQSVKDYETVLPLLVSARNSPKTPAGDLQMIYTIGKILDPGSVVREGELQLTQNAQPLLSKLVGTYQKQVRGGAVLPDEVRQQFLAMLNERALGYRQAYDQDYQTYAGYAERYGMIPRDVVGRHAANAYRQGSAPAADNSPGRAAADSYLQRATNGNR